MSSSPYTDEQIKWINENVSLGIFKNKKHFVQVFNAVFNDERTFDAMAQYLQHHGLKLVTEYTIYSTYSDEQKQWLIDNYDKYEVFADLVRDFNSYFSTNKSHASITSYCVRTLKLRQFDKNRYNAGQFKKGLQVDEAPLGTIRYNKQRNMCFIKVQMCKGASRDTAGHNLKAPFWKPLQDKIWEDSYGDIPDGYMACSLTNNPYEQDIKNIALIDKRGKSVMSRKDWWSDNAKFTGTAVEWCNLYFVAKDNGVYNNASDKILQ